LAGFGVNNSLKKYKTSILIKTANLTMLLTGQAGGLVSFGLYLTGKK